MIQIKEKHHKLVINCSFAIALFLLFFSASRIALSDIATQKYDWNSSRQLRSGIQYAHIKLFAPRKIVVNCLQIDTHTPGLRLYTTPRCTEWVEGKSETIRQTTRNFIRESQQTHQKLAVAINASPFSPWPAPYQKEESTNISGFSVSQGVVVSNQNNIASLFVSKNGMPKIAKVSAEVDISEIETAVSGFGLCLVDGKTIVSGTDLHPRTGIGLSKNGQYVFFLTIDGRQLASFGATVQDVGNLLKMFGAYTGINMDGGGSTTMAWWDPTMPGTDKCQLLNQPVGNGDDYKKTEETPIFTPTERANGNNLGVYFLETNKGLSQKTKK